MMVYIYARPVVYIYIWIEREGEKESERERYRNIYIYIYIFIYRERSIYSVWVAYGHVDVICMLYRYIDIISWYVEAWMLQWYYIDIYIYREREREREREIYSRYIYIIWISGYYMDVRTYGQSWHWRMDMLLIFGYM